MLREGLSQTLFGGQVESIDVLDSETGAWLNMRLGGE